MESKAEALKLINTIERHGKKLDAEIQRAAIISVYYSLVHGDVTIGQKLCEKLNAGSRKAALIGFMEHFGNFEAKDKSVKYRNNNIVLVIETEGQPAQEISLHEDAENGEVYCSNIKLHWTSFKPEKIESKFNCEEQVKSFLSRMERAIKAGNAEHSEAYDVIALAWNEFQEKQEKELIAQEQAKKDDTDNVHPLAAAVGQN